MEGSRPYSQKVLTQRSLMMPHKKDGEVDWQTLGNILTANIIEEVMYGSYVDMKHRPSRPSFTVDTDWKFSYEENGVVVLRKQSSDSPFHCWMGRAVIDFPLAEIASFIADPLSAPLFDKYIVESRVVEPIAQSDLQTDGIAYYRFEAKQCLVKTSRDVVFYIRYAHFDGKYVQTAMSVDHSLCPPLNGVIRAQIEPGSGWHLEPYMDNPNRTLVSYLAHMDLVGLPPIIANRVLRRQPLNILYVEKHLKQRHLQQHKQQQQQQQQHHSETQSLSISNHQQGKQVSDKQFEDPLPIIAFITGDLRRTVSDPYQN